MVQKDNISSVICLGVDFMSESVQAILDRHCADTAAQQQQQQEQHPIPVFRATSQPIGCSLAEAAERSSYRAWLQQESSRSLRSGRPCLHVVYINTSLETKAVSNTLMPTITCTSSNVLRTILQATAQIPNLRIMYGPDTYMGENIRNLLLRLSNEWSDQRIAAELHPLHNRATLSSIVQENLVVFPAGNCIVHHMFGQSVVDTVHRHYHHAYVTAHLEVPGEMFDIALQKSFVDQGVVGSTSDILNFITRKVQEHATTNDDDRNNSTPQRVQFILGTEAGMVTSIVKNIRQVLSSFPTSNIEAEIIFPVSDDAIMATNDVDRSNTSLAIVPGVSGGDGCSTAGGCATCPFMKKNDLDTLMDVLDLIIASRSKESMVATKAQTRLNRHRPPDRLKGKVFGVGTKNSPSALDVGTEPIRYMRELMRTNTIPPALVQRIILHHSPVSSTTTTTNLSMRDRDSSAEHELETMIT
jgi:quinolinate synthase